MKFEDYLMKSKHDKQKRLQLEEEVIKLQAELEMEEKINEVLQCALVGPVPSQPSLSSFPFKIQVILMELGMVEDQIVWLERKVENLKTNLYEERRETKELVIQQEGRRLRKQKTLRGRSHKEHKDDDQFIGPRNQEQFGMYKMIRERRSSRRFNERGIEKLNRSDKHIRDEDYLDIEAQIETPNEISERLIKCFINMFLKMNQQTALIDDEGSSVSVPKLALACMNSKKNIPKSSFGRKTAIYSYTNNALYIDPCEKLQELDSTYLHKKFIQITRKSLDTTRISECFQEMEELRVLMHQLCNADLTFLTNKQKLAFWINIYNACIMHAFLQYGLPSSEDKLLALMNKAALNVGGIVLNVLAIEHFILRHPYDAIHESAKEEGILHRHTYAMGYPEPNVTFALCRGSWSSPALRVYTAAEVVNELGRAKLEYLEASVIVTNRKKILVPKLLQWHMRDFADNMESLIEWIYSQLTHSGTLKRLIKECLNGESTSSPLSRMVEIQPYESEFRYLIPV